MATEVQGLFLFLIMFYKILSLSLVAFGSYHVVHAFLYASAINEYVMWEVSEGVSTILVGILNYVYLYETHNTETPKTILLACNGLFIGYLVLMIVSHLNVIPSYISLTLVFACSILVLNRKV